MAATSERDQIRLVVEDVIACCTNADDHLRVALMRLVQRARTAEEAAIIQEVLQARQAITRMKQEILKLHPNRKGD